MQADTDAELAKLRGSVQRREVRDPGSACVDELRGNLKRTYDYLQGELKTDSAKGAMKEHYIVMRKSIDDLALVPGESTRAYEQRSEANRQPAACK